MVRQSFTLHLLGNTLLCTYLAIPYFIPARQYLTLCSKEMKEMSARAPSCRSGGVAAQLSECLQGATIRPLALSLMLHTVQIWCGFNVIIFKV